MVVNLHSEGLTVDQRHCLLLGIEYGRFLSSLDVGIPFTAVAHSDNVLRLTQLLLSSNRAFVKDGPEAVNLDCGSCVVEMFTFKVHGAE